MRHTIAVLVENEFGVLARVAGLFSGRGFNIDSLSVAETQEEGTSLITLVTRGDDAIIEQIIKQLHKLVNVLKVTDMQEGTFLDRELVLLKVHASEETKPELLRLVEIFRGRVIDVAPRSYTVELVGDSGKIKAVLELMRPLGIREIVRTGKVAMPRGTQG
ncbi:MAG: acetolactate synthase small subunit [Deferrisomatales bacterium]|nr:acetolactate synthase small subunit [Deferrisomatales bacterium]HSH68658.1 acetolactate synthase small subunit [Deferrisomatales bacterium]